MIYKKVVVPLLFIIFLASMANIANATSISYASVDWSTFKITADGADVTSLISWDRYQADYAEASYRDPDSGGTVYTLHDIDPNPNWSINQNTSDGSIAKANISLSDSSVSVSAIANYTSEASSDNFREGGFTVAADATYAFSFDYSLFAEVNATNNGSVGGASLFASSYVELLVINDSIPGSFYFVFDDSTDINGFGTILNSGTLSATQYFNGNDFDFHAGDLISVAVTTSSAARSFSSISPPVPTPVPAPPAFVLFITGFGIMLSFKVAKKLS